MMGTKLRAFAPLCNRSLEDLVPASNVYRHLEAKLDLSFVRDLVGSTYKAQCLRTWPYPQSSGLTRWRNRR